MTISEAAKATRANRNTIKDHVKALTVKAFMMTGDAANADPVCDKSPHHQALLDDVERIGKIAAKEDKTDLKEQPLIFRNMKIQRKFLREKN